MLEECARLLDEVGYEGLTTKEVARRAEVPIGTFYQFFPDKQGLVRALAFRNLDAFLARVTATLASARISDWTEATDLVIDEFVWMKRFMPGFNVFDFGVALAVPGTSRMLDEALEDNLVVADRLRGLLIGLIGVPAGRRAGAGVRGGRRGRRRRAQAGLPGLPRRRPRPHRRVQAAGAQVPVGPSRLA